MFGQKVKKLRTSNKMTQSELASKLEISPSAIGMYEQDRREPSFELVMKIANLFNVTVDYLISNDEEEVRADVLYKSSKSRNDLSEKMNEFKQELLLQKGLMFKGVPLTDDEIVKVLEAMDIGMQVALKEKEV